MGRVIHEPQGHTRPLFGLLKRYGHKPALMTRQNGHFFLMIDGRVFRDQNGDRIGLPSSPSDPNWLKQAMRECQAAGLLPSAKKQVDWHAKETAAARKVAQALEEWHEVHSEVERNPEAQRSFREKVRELCESGKGDPLMAAVKRIAKLLRRDRDRL